MRCSGFSNAAAADKAGEVTGGPVQNVLWRSGLLACLQNRAKIIVYSFGIRKDGIQFWIRKYGVGSACRGGSVFPADTSGNIIRSLHFKTLPKTLHGIFIQSTE
jgi:hypothetical protein